MEVHTFFSLLAACFGLLGSVFLAKGILGLSPKDMLKLTTPYSRLKYAPEQIDSMAAQKADAFIGVIIIFLAFLVQIVSLIFVSNNHSLLFKDQWIGSGIASAVTSILAIIFYSIDKYYYKYLRLKIRKLECVAKLKDIFAKEEINSNDVKFLEGILEELLSIKRKPSETKIDFIKRVAEYLGQPIPEGINFSSISGKHN
ncbi:MAG: hypothetical protein LWW94_09860 [Candidatus Desulfofervidaceae bacterium]|nr:hypothetical protein [Candidatus Desulfofervidaceae bacterium]